MSNRFYTEFDSETLGPGRVQPLTESYMLAGRQIVDRQLLAAGVRLAEVLNSAFQ